MESILRVNVYDERNFRRALHRRDIFYEVDEGKYIVFNSDLEDFLSVVDDYEGEVEFLL